MSSKIARIALLFLICIGVSPSLVHAQGPPPRFSKERFVIKAMAHLNAAQATYQATTGSGSFGTLAQLRSSGLIDGSLADGNKYGYAFVVTPSQNSYTATATPIRYRKSGLWSYYIDQGGILFGKDKGGLLADRNDIYVDTCALWGLADNERCTAGAMRTLHGAEATFAATAGNGNYGLLTELLNAGLIDMVLGTGSKHGYNFEISLTSQPQASFSIRSRPTQHGVTGRLSFYIDQTGILRGADHGGLPAGPEDPPINW